MKVLEDRRVLVLIWSSASLVSAIFPTPYYNIVGSSTGVVGCRTLAQ